MGFRTEADAGSVLECAGSRRKFSMGIFRERTSRRKASAKARARQGAKMRDRTQAVLAKSLGAVGVGAALMFFLDPDRGNRRRALLRDKAMRLAKNSGASFRKATRDLGNRATGILAETRSRVIRNGSVD